MQSNAKEHGKCTQGIKIMPAILILNLGNLNDQVLAQRKFQKGVYLFRTALSTNCQDG